MKLSQLTEGISATLYHITSINGVIKILSGDRIRLSASFANDSEASTGNKSLFFLSTTRSKTGGYTLRTTYKGAVMLVLDGTALGHKYAGGPVDYWGPRISRSDPRYNEMEDRIYNTKPYIDNAISYIKEIHVLLGDMGVKARSLITQSKKLNIPLFLYKDQQSFILQDKSKSVSFKDFSLLKPDPADRPWPPYNSRSSKKAQLRRSRQQGKPNLSLSYDLTKWTELMYRPVSQWDKLGYSKRSFLTNLVWSHDNADDIRSLEADLHNAKNKPDEITTIAALMRKHKLYNASDIIQFVKHRWERVAKK